MVAESGTKNDPKVQACAMQKLKTRARFIQGHPSSPALNILHAQGPRSPPSFSQRLRLDVVEKHEEIKESMSGRALQHRSDFTSFQRCVQTQVIVCARQVVLGAGESLRLRFLPLRSGRDDDDDMAGTLQGIAALFARRCDSCQGALGRSAPSTCIRREMLLVTPADRL